MKFGKVIIMLLGIVLAILIIAFFDRRLPRNDQGEPLTPRVDTLIIRDTNTFTEPKTEPSAQVVTKEIPIPVYLADSTKIDSLLNECARLERIGDSLQLVLLRVQRHYCDSTFDAWVSGVDPRLDSIKTYQTTRVITREIPVIQVKKTRWGIGIQGGVTIGKDGLHPYLGIGGSYNFLSW